MLIQTKNPKKVLEEIQHGRAQKTDHLGILDSIYENQQKKVKFEVH